MLKLFPTALLMALFPLLLQAAPTGSNMQSRPLSFIENSGQVTGTDKNTRTDIDVKLKATNVTIYIGDGQIHYLWKKKMANPGTQKPISDDKPHVSFETYRMDVELVGANKNAELIKEDKQEYYENYYLPQCPNGVTAHTYGKITYKNVYPNIDWVLYARNNELKYDFVVRPGGRVSDIRLRYNGATGLSMKNGAVTARTPFGSITEKKPYSYDVVTKKEIASSFVLNNGELRFAVAASEHTIVIDPVLAWGSYYGESSEDDSPQAIATDSAGNVYLTGYTTSNDEITYPLLGIFYKINVDGFSDAFVSKFNRDGKWVWATYYGGSGEEFAYDIAVHKNGSVYITGTTNSPVGLAPSSGVHQEQNGGGNDAFVAVFDQTGWPQWGTYFGGPADDEAKRLAVDGFGDVYITGLTRSDTMIGTANGLVDTFSGGYSDAYLAKIGSSGNLLWSTYMGTGLDDEGMAVVVDAHDNVFMSGRAGAGVPWAGDIYLTPDAELDSAVGTFGFITKFSPPGNVLYSSLVDSAYNSQDLCTDAVGNLYMAANVPTLNGIIYHIIKFNSGGKKQWLRGLSGPRIRVDNEGNIYTVNNDWEKPGIATPGAHQPNYGGAYDGYIIKYDTACNKTWASYYGGIYNDRITGLALGKWNKLYICGNTNSPNNIATTGTHKDTWTGNFLSNDGFFAKFHDTIVAMYPVTDTVICAPDTIDVSYAVAVVFRAGNVFTAQLSDAAGSFANPVTIGSIASDTDGTIQAVIPANTPPGTGYRVRVVASTPGFITPGLNQSIEVLEHPHPTISGITTACTGDSLGITASSTVPGVSFAWNKPEGTTLAGASVTIPHAAGNHGGRYVVTASNRGCTSKDSIQLTVHPRPYVVKMSTTAPVCAGTDFSVDVEGSMQNVVYNWRGPDGFTSTGKTPVIAKAEPKNAGNYFVFMTSDKGCVSDSNHIFADIVRLEAHINNIEVRTPGDTIKLEGWSNTDGVTWAWAGPAGFISDIQNPIIEDIGVDQRGDYFLTISKYGCTAKTSIYVRVSEEIKFILYPNPNDGRFTTKGNTLKDQLVKMEVVDMAGRSMFRDEAKTFRKHFKKELDTEGRLANGSYILRLNVEGKKRDVRFAVGQ